MSGKDGIVWLDNCGRDTRGRVDSEFELAFLAVVGSEAFEKKCTEP